MDYCLFEVSYCSVIWSNCCSAYICLSLCQGFMNSTSHIVGNALFALQWCCNFELQLINVSLNLLGLMSIFKGARRHHLFFTKWKFLVVQIQVGNCNLMGQIYKQWLVKNIYIWKKKRPENLLSPFSIRMSNNGCKTLLLVLLCVVDLAIIHINAWGI